MDTHFKMTVSQTPAINGPRVRAGGHAAARQRAFTGEEIWNSRLYFPLVMGFSALCLFTGQELFGMLALVAFATYLQFTCSDLLANLLPIVLFILLGTKYYDNIAALLPIWWILPPFFASLLYNFLHWPVRIRKCACFKSLLAVSAAGLLGGVGVISAKEYFSFNGFMYAFGLGLGMLALSVMYSTNMARAHGYSVADRFCRILYCVGLFTGLVVVNYYLTHFAEFLSSETILYIHFRNYLTTMLVLALPIPFRYVKNSRVHAPAIAFMYAALLLTGSRSALVFGTVILFAGTFLTLAGGKKLGRKSLWLLAAFAVAAAVVIFALGQTVLNSRLVDGKLFPVTDSRILFLKQSVLDFLSSPINGIGLANMKNSQIFLGVGGSMVWYHNYFAQIIGSMGLIGVIAYGWLLRDRFQYLKTLHLSGETMLVLSYLGILMVSMTNPGEFCPLPNELLVVLLFDVAETVRAARAESTVSAETTYVIWTPARRAVKAGVYLPLRGTVSVSSGSKSLAPLPDYAARPAARADEARRADRHAKDGL